MTQPLAVVTGASRGLGLAIADRLAAEGHPVVLVARTQTSLDAAAETVGVYGGDVYTRCADLADPAQIVTVLEQLEVEAGPISVLVNNAGIFEPYSLADTDIDNWQRTADVNVTSVLMATKTVVRHMVPRGYGRIVNVASTTGVVGVPGAIGYAMSKAAVVALTRCTAVELARTGITVNAVAPGMFRTDMTDTFRSDEATEKISVGRAPMRRWGQPAELAAAVAYFASEGASFTTGQILGVDGGWTA